MIITSQVKPNWLKKMLSDLFVTEHWFTWKSQNEYANWCTTTHLHLKDSYDWIIRKPCQIVNNAARGAAIPYKNYLAGTLIQPLAKAMAKITKGVDMPKMMM
uniref:Uncharacterized protein LOC105641510 n=1 Tax=Rhizophora mucronata TaxID=61149 RepID=A0A2P2KLI8_RHIMU